jgi:hypothetical protein
MARSRKHALPGNDTQPDQVTENAADPATDFDPAQLERQTEERAASAFVANPSTTRRGHAAAVTRRQHDLPDKMTMVAGDLKVQMIDRGSNEAGVGIKVVFLNGRKPTPEELEIIRDHMKGENGRPGLNWDRHAGMWHAEIVRPGEHPNEVPASRPVAVRLSVESRVQKLAEALREHQADPAGFAEQVRQRREQGSERVPF